MDRKAEYNKIAEKIVGHVKNGTTDQAESVISIPTSDYTCKKRWNAEIKNIFVLKLDTFKNSLNNL